MYLTPCMALLYKCVAYVSNPITIAVLQHSMLNIYIYQYEGPLSVHCMDIHEYNCVQRRFVHVATVRVIKQSLLSRLCCMNQKKKSKICCINEFRISNLPSCSHWFRLIIIRVYFVSVCILITVACC